MLSPAAPYQDSSPSTHRPLTSTLTRPSARCPPASPRKGPRAGATPRSPRHPPSCHVDDTSLVRNTSRTGAASCAMQRAGGQASPPAGTLQRRKRARSGTRLPPSPCHYTAVSRSRLAALPLLRKPTFPLHCLSQTFKRHESGPRRRDRQKEQIPGLPIFRCTFCFSKASKAFQAPLRERQSQEPLSERERAEELPPAWPDSCNGSCGDGRLRTKPQESGPFFFFF